MQTEKETIKADDTISTLIEEILTPYTFIKLSKKRKGHVIEIVCLMIPLLNSTRPVKLDPLYRIISEKTGIDSYKSIKTSLTCAYETFLATKNFHDMYEGEWRDKDDHPKQKEFFMYIAALVKERL